MNQSSRAIAVLPSLEAIGQAVDQLVLAGFPLAQIFLVGQDTRSAKRGRTALSDAVSIKELLHEANLDTVTGSTAQVEKGVMLGNFAGGMTGLLLGVSLLTVPAVGVAVLSYTFAYLLSTVGLGTLVGGTIGAVVSQNLSEQVINSYKEQVTQGNYLLVVSGSEAQIFRAEHILHVKGHRPQPLT